MSAWITRVTYDGDAVQARNLIVQTLVDAGFVDVRTTTVEAWMDEAMNETPPPMGKARPMWEPEHTGSTRQRLNGSRGARPNA